MRQFIRWKGSCIFKESFQISFKEISAILFEPFCRLGDLLELRTFRHSFIFSYRSFILWDKENFCQLKAIVMFKMNRGLRPPPFTGNDYTSFICLES